MEEPVQAGGWATPTTPTDLPGESKPPAINQTGGSRLRSATISINGAEQTFPPDIPTAQQHILDTLR